MAHPTASNPNVTSDAALEAARRERFRAQEAATQRARELVAQQERERVQRAAEEGAARLEQFEASTKSRFLANGGSESEWRSAWPAIKLEHLRTSTENDSLESRTARAKAAMMGNRRPL